jgi:hypothetical protein
MSRLQLFPSKIILFLDFHITQQAVITNSPKMLFPKSVLACSIISRGSKSQFYEMERRFQHAVLKGHSKNKWKLLSSEPVLQRTHMQSSNYIFFFVNRFLVLSLSLRRSQKKKKCAYQGLAARTLIFLVLVVQVQ